MIIHPGERDYVFITQPDHAALAARIMEHCVDLQKHPRAPSILLAIAEHDNGWAEADAEPTVSPESGEPFDFVHAPAAVRQDVWPRGVARLSADPWAAALVAHHAVVVYDRYRGDEEWAAFFPRMESLRDSLICRTDHGSSDLFADYRFVRLADLVSLVFCTGWTEPQRYEDWMISRIGDAVSVDPGVFDSESLLVTVSTKRLPRVPYRTSTELQAALAAAPFGTLQGEVVGSVK